MIAALALMSKRRCRLSGSAFSIGAGAVRKRIRCRETCELRYCLELDVHIRPRRNALCYAHRRF